MQPPRNAGNRSKTPSKMSAGEEHLGRVVDGHVVLGADVLAAAEEVGDRDAVVVELRRDQPPRAADVQHERHVALGERAPDGVIVGMRRAVAVPEGTAREMHRRAAEVEGLRDRLQRQFGRPPGHHRDRQQNRGPRRKSRRYHDCARRAPPKLSSTSSPRYCVGANVEKNTSCASNPNRSSRGSLRPVESPESVPPLLHHQPVLQPARRCVGPADFQPRPHRLRATPAAPKRQRPNPLTNTGIGVRLQPTRQLHEMTVGIQHPTCAGVGHVNLLDTFETPVCPMADTEAMVTHRSRRAAGGRVAQVTVASPR